MSVKEAVFVKQCDSVGCGLDSTGKVQIDIKKR